MKYDEVFVFDMDKTLIDTDKANNLAYFDAIYSVTNFKCDIDYGKRFTRNMLKTLFPNLAESQFKDIVTYKEKFFKLYLKETILNQKLFVILKCLYQEGHRTILLTNCHSERAICLCNYYNLTKYFVQRFFFEDYIDNKYKFLKSLGYDLRNVVLYENEAESSLEAVNNGIKVDNIIKVEF